MSKNQMKFILLAVFCFMTLFLFAPMQKAQAGYEEVQAYTGARFLVTGDFSSFVDVRRIITISYIDTSGYDQSVSFEEVLDCNPEGDAYIDNQALQLDGMGDFVRCEISDYEERVRTLAEKDLGKEWSGFVNPQMTGVWAEATVKVTKTHAWLPVLTHSEGDIRLQVYDGVERGSGLVQIGVQGVSIPAGAGFYFYGSPSTHVRGELDNCAWSACDAYYYQDGYQVGQAVPFTNQPMYVSPGTTFLYIGGEDGGFNGSIENFAWDPNSCPGCF